MWVDSWPNGREVIISWEKKKTSDVNTEGTINPSSAGAANASSPGVAAGRGALKVRCNQYLGFRLYCCAAAAARATRARQQLFVLKNTKKKILPGHTIG